MAEIVVLRGGAELSRTRLSDAELVVGRLDSSGIPLPSGRVSRQHARIVPAAGGWLYSDSGSANGSFLGEERIRERRLADGDRITIADFTLVFVAHDAGPAPAAPGAAAPPDREPSTRSLGVETLGDVLQSVLFDPQARQSEGAERLQALFEISQILEDGGSQDFHKTLVQILDKAIAIMGGERGFLMLAEPQSGALSVHVARNRAGQDLPPGEREALSRGLIGKVVEAKKPLLILDAQSEVGSLSVMEHSIHSAVCAPLITRGTLTGVLYVDHRERPKAFNEQDLAFFTTFAYQAKAAINASKAYWELVDSLFKASDDFIVITDVAGSVSQANVAACELIGAGDIAGRQLAELVVESDREGVVALTAATLERGLVSGRELSIRRPDGRAVPMSLSSFVMRDRAGAAIGQCLIGRDLTEMRALIDRLEVRSEFIKRTFGRYLSDDVVASLLATPEGLELGGQKRTVTIMMTDLRGFTAISERLPPEQVVAILNHYLGEMAEIVARFQGTIDEFIGDAILVIFGAPTERRDDALRAAACAVEMQRAMEPVNAWNLAHGYPAIEMGIGLNTGDVVVGNIGSERRAKYGVVGRVVNLAARIESNTVGGQILIADSTYQSSKDRLQVRDSLELRVKGVEGVLVAHDLVGVGAPFDCSLRPADDELRLLRDLLAIEVVELEGKQVGDARLGAQLVRLGTRQAELRASRTWPPRSNLKLLLPGTGGRPHAELYGKVVDRAAATPGNVIVHFTAVPPEAEELLRRLV